MRVALGVSGGIAAYKSAILLRALAEDGCDVTVVPTADALRFVGAATFEALSGNPVSETVFDKVDEVRHVRVGQQSDLVVVAPATADLLARAAAGMANDLLTATLLVARCPVLFVPAMHTEMWAHPATRANVALLRDRGNIVLEPAVGRLTGPDVGIGRMPEPQEIAAVVRAVLGELAAGRDWRADLTSRRVVVSAGGTREFIDPVRFLGNRSSGRQGWALAQVAAARGASVTVVAANVGLADPAGCDVVRVTSAAELGTATVSACHDADAVVMAAAVADFRPVEYHVAKVKKRAGVAPEAVALTVTPDVLADLVRRRQDGSLPGGLVIVGFAAETGDASGSVLDHGREKLDAKGCDLMVVNEVGTDKGFESPANSATILSRSGQAVSVPYGPKESLACRVWDLVADRLTTQGLGPDL